tara:strand:+ start:804 stop:1397 length:594 start_codon:yes stop_codon:yes gene_type:complete
MQVYDLFPTLVIKFPNIITEDERVGIFNDLKTRDINPHPTIQGDGASSYHSNIFSILKELGLEDRILEYLIEYNKVLRAGYNLKLSQSWFNVQNYDSALEKHMHPNSICSGALYINVDNDSTPLCFVNHNTQSRFIHHGIVGEEASVYNAEYWRMPVSNGDLIIFPSWLEHGSGGMNHTYNRTVISFNTYASYENNR